MTGEALVEATDVARTFGTGPVAVVAVHDVTCVIHAGDHIALTGPSGSGKTTLIHLLAGLDHPTHGTVTWPGIGTAATLRPGPVAVVFQAPSLIPALDALENVALPLLLEGVDRPEAIDRARHALDRLELGDHADRLPDGLSGGQAQRIAVARALAGRPRLLLADEPTGQLDQHNARSVIDALLVAADECRAGLIVNTHDPAVARRLPIRWLMTGGHLDTNESARC